MKRINTILIAASILAILCISGAAIQAKAAESPFEQGRFSHPLIIDNPYFPLVAGRTYIYRGKSGDASTYEELVVTRNTMKVSGVIARVVRDKNWESGHLIEDTFDWYAQDDAGNVWYLGEYSTQYENGKVVGHEGSWRAGTNGAVAGIIMEWQPKVGDTYQQEYLAGVAEDMAAVLSLNRTLCVTYGCFSHLLKTKETTALEPGIIEYKYYALGVGEIRSRVPQEQEESHLVKILNR